MMLRIDNFHSFATSNAKYKTSEINVNNIECFISVELCRFCETSKRHITLSPSSAADSAEFLAIYVHGKKMDEKKSPSIFDIMIKFARSSFSKKCWFFFESVNGYQYKQGVEIKLDVCNLNTFIYWLFMLSTLQTLPIRVKLVAFETLGEM